MEQHTMNIQADVIQQAIDANSQVVSDKEVIHGNGWTWEADVQIAKAESQVREAVRLNNLG